MIITEKNMPDSQEILERLHFVKAMFIMSDGKFRTKRELAQSLSSSLTNKDLVDLMELKGIISIECRKSRSDYYGLTEKGRAIANMLIAAKNVLDIEE